MVQNLAFIKISNDCVLPIRVHINRKQILTTTSNDTTVQAPLLSNNTIVCLKSPLTKLYLSNTDLKNLSEDVKEDLLIILYDLTSPSMKEHILNKLRVGHSIDFKENVIEKLNDSLHSNLSSSSLTSIKRVGRFRYKLTFRKNWDADIYISNIKKLETIRTYLIFKDQYPQWTEYPCIEKRKSLMLMEQSVDSQHNDPSILVEEDDAMTNTDEASNQKPSITFKYTSILSLIQCIDLYVLKRPKRKRNAQTTTASN
ncbi:hypothetical protein RNJ44_02156 [Nakaseomyces bracarensis]|uniref:Uncharacterized protein n=1 Tax=Nakaseomyces bracarensis TaxID=273131 RepID=A0ABR4NMM9_9SACH